MLEKPDLADAVLVDYVGQGWAIVVDSLAFMPVGYDDLAWSYDVRTRDGERLFGKVRRGTTSPAAARVPLFLYEHGVSQVVAPIAARDGEPWFRADGYQVTLYPFIAGVRPSKGLSDEQWIEYGAFLGALHRTVLPDALTTLVPMETFAGAASAAVRELARHVTHRQFTDRIQRELAEFWRSHEREIAEIADRTEQLATLVAGRSTRHVLCHADIHTGNLLIDHIGRLFVVDWDDITMAPPECDLMFILGSEVGGLPVSEHQEALFRRGYGPIDVNWPLLAYYRYQRVSSDLDAFARSVFFRDDLGDETKANDVWWFRRQFEPGEAIDLARSTESHLVR